MNVCFSLNYLPTTIWEAAESGFFHCKIGDQTPFRVRSDTQKAYPLPSRVLGMSKLGEPAVFEPGFSYITCLRCKTSVCVRDTGSSVKLVYDVDDWQRSSCCCLHLDGPVSCFCFGELQQVINGLPLTN